MLKVYLLPVERILNTDKVKGIEFIHSAILECTGKPDVRKLIIDADATQDAGLSAVAIEVRDPTVNETARYQAEVFISEPVRDLAAEIDDLKARIIRLERLGAKE